MNKSKWATGIFAGAIIGAAAALLLSPKAGKENRQALTAKTGEIRQRAGGYIGNIRNRFRKETDDESEETVGSPSGNSVQTHD